MAVELRSIRLHGRVIVTGTIQAVTGLRIGGRPTGIEIGGIDNIVIRNPLSNEPYVPGSSLRGKMRSLYERFTGADLNYPIDAVRIHSCSREVAVSAKRYPDCLVCRIFGLPAEGGRGENPVVAEHPTPLVVRDVPLAGESRKRLQAENYSEVKWEASIDRITSAAVPRQMERVPGGAKFGPFELVQNVYLQRNVEDLAEIFTALRLVEDDYLGGLGSRGSGKVTFDDIEVRCMGQRDGRYVLKGEPRTYDEVSHVLRDDGKDLVGWAARLILT